MKADQSKASREKQVFLEFIQKSGLPIDLDSVENRVPPEPDILCRHQTQGFIAFELVSLRDADIARTTAPGKTESVSMWTADPTPQTICHKLQKHYATPHPLELLCYTMLLVTPDDIIIPTVQHIIELRGLGMFRRMWLLGERCVWRSGEEGGQIISEWSISK
jgi:hypothetical protein